MLQLLKPVRPGAQALQREKPAQKEALALQLQNSPPSNEGQHSHKQINKNLKKSNDPENAYNIMSMEKSS